MRLERDSRFDETDLPEVKVRAALQGVEWVVTDWPPSGEVPVGSYVKARLMRSQCCVARLAREGALWVLRGIVRWDAEPAGAAS